MITYRQSTLRATTVWLVSLLMIFSPLLAQAHTWQPDKDPQVVMEMPCHQDQSNQSSLPSCPHCDESGASLLCGCCDQALSPSLLSQQDLTFGLFLPRGKLFSRLLLSRPNPPPTDRYRPPIAS